MNKIFKVVWSKVKHCYVVVSEIAKNTISGGARKSRVRKGALAAALVTTVLGSSFVMPNSAWAVPVEGGGTITGNGKDYTYHPDGDGDDIPLSSTSSHILFAPNGDVYLLDSGSNKYIYSPVGTIAASGKIITVSGSSNIDVVTDDIINAGIRNYTVSLKNLVELKNEAGTTTTITLNGNDGSMQSNSLTIGSVNINSTGINAGSKKITNVEAGVNGTDAVNVNQLIEYVAANDTYTTKVTASKSVDNKKDLISTTYTTNRKGQDGKDITYPGISFKEGANIDLELNGNEITISSTATGTGSNYSWIVKDNLGNSKEITTDANELSFEGTGAANVVLDAENNTLTVSATDTHITNLEQSITNYKKEDKSGGVITTTITTNGEQNNVYTKYVDISPYVKDVVLNETVNATYTENTTIGQQISQNISNISTNTSNITNLTNTVNAGWVAKIDNTEIKITPATTEKPNANVLNFAATGAATVSLSGNTLTIGAVDTYTTRVTANATTDENDKIVINTTYEKNDNNTYPGISFVAGENIELSANETGTAITISSTATGTGSNYSWVVKDNHDNSKEITNDANKLSFVGTGAANVVLDAENNTLTVSATDTTYSVGSVEKDNSGTTTYTVLSSAVDEKGDQLKWEIKDTNTTYTVTKDTNPGSNEVGKWNVNEIGKEKPIATIVDTDTKVLSGSVVDGDNGSYGINLVTNERTEDDKEVIVPISGLHDYYTTGVSVEDGSLKFNRNAGGSYDVNFVAGGGNSKEGDTYVKVSASGGLITLPTGSKVIANKDKIYQANQVLEDITINGQKYTLGYSWKLGVEGGNGTGTDGDIVVNSGQTLKLAEGQNVKLDYQNNTITISALVKGYSNDLPAQQSTKLLANGSEESSKTATQQLKMIEINGELFAVPNIKAVSTSVEGAPILKAVELNGQVYNLDTNSGAMNSWTAEVGDKELNVAEGDVVTYTSDDNIILSAEPNVNGGGSINVSLSNDITLRNTESNGTIATIEIKGSESTIKVGDSADKQVTINGNQGSIAIGKNVAINADGDATFGNVSIAGANGSVVVGKINITGTDGNATITGLTNTYWDGETFVSGRAATEDQLKQAISNVTATLTQSDKYVDYSKTYEVNVENEIVLDVVNSDKDVIIENVAKHSDLGNVSDFNSDLKNSDNSHTSVVQAVNSLDDKVNKGWTAKINGKDVQNIQMGGSQNFVAGQNIELTASGNDIVVSTAKDVTFEKVTVGDVVVDSEGINAGLKNITNVKDGDVNKDSKDAVNGSQLYATNQAIINNHQSVQNLNAGLNKLGSRMNKVGAGSAALAALHPMDFDPDDKLQFSAGVGHYGGENAAALGAFYRPTEKVMFSVAGTMGNGEDMVNAGVTFALDKPNNVSNSRVAMAREIQDLRQQVAALTMLVMQMASRDNAALAGVAMFPDVPENHWAYDYIEGLQKQGIIEGYPDGNFGGDRSMTRYEFAAMLYRALEKGFPVDSRLLNEFNAELGRIRVDRIKGADNDANKVERVRVNNYEDRDDYGSKIVQVKAGA